jgi:hypothetical protein
MQFDVEVIHQKAYPMPGDMELMERNLSCRIMHSIRGRLRIALPLLKSKKERIGCLQHHLSSTKWIEKVEIHLR